MNFTCLEACGGTRSGTPVLTLTRVSRTGLSFCGEMDGDWIATRLGVVLAGVLATEEGVILECVAEALGVTRWRGVWEEARTGGSL